MELEWPVRREAVVVDEAEIDSRLGVPRGISPLVISADYRAWTMVWSQFDEAAPCWIARRVVEEVEAGKLTAPWIRPSQPIYRHANGQWVRQDAKGRPLNPKGRDGRNVATGGYWHPGPNLAGDGAAVTYYGGQWYILLVQRLHDGGLWALPGGMCDRGELPAQTVPREVGEETGLVSRPSDRWQGIYHGQVDNGYAYTWVETGLYVCRVEAERMDLPLVPQLTEVLAARWKLLYEMTPEQLHAGHADLLHLVRQHLSG